MRAETDVDVRSTWAGIRLPGKHGKFALGSIDVMLRIAHQGVCLPQYGALIRQVGVYTSVPEDQKARHGSQRSQSPWRSPITVILASSFICTPISPFV